MSVVVGVALRIAKLIFKCFFLNQCLFFLIRLSALSMADNPKGWADEIEADKPKGR